MRGRPGNLSNNTIHSPAVLRTTLIFLCLVLFGSAVANGQAKMETADTSLMCDDNKTMVAYAYHQAILAGDIPAKSLHVVLRSQSPAKVFGIYIFNNQSDQIIRDDDKGLLGQGQVTKDKPLKNAINTFLETALCKSSDGQIPDKIDSVFVKFAEQVHDGTDIKLSALLVSAELTPLNPVSLDYPSQEKASQLGFSNGAFVTSGNVAKLPESPDPKIDVLRQTNSALNQQNVGLLIQKETLQSQNDRQYWLATGLTLTLFLIFGVVLVSKVKSLYENYRGKASKNDKPTNDLWPNLRPDQIRQDLNRVALNHELVQLINKYETHYKGLGGVRDPKTLAQTSVELAGEFKEILIEHKAFIPIDLGRALNAHYDRGKYQSLLSKIRHPIKARKASRQDPFPAFQELLKAVEKYDSEIFPKEPELPAEPEIKTGIPALIVPEAKNEDDLPTDVKEEVGEGITKEFVNQTAQILTRVNALPGQDYFTNLFTNLPDNLARKVKDDLGKMGSSEGILKDLHRRMPLKNRDIEFDAFEVNKSILDIFNFVESSRELIQPQEQSLAGLSSNLAALKTKKTVLEGYQRKEEGYQRRENVSLLDVLDEAYEDLKSKDKEITDFHTLFTAPGRINESHLDHARQIVGEHKTIQNSLTLIQDAQIIDGNIRALPQQVDKLIEKANLAATFEQQKIDFENQYHTENVMRTNLEQRLKELNSFIRGIFPRVSNTVNSFLSYLGYEKSSEIDTPADERTPLDINPIEVSFTTLEGQVDKAINEAPPFKSLRTRLLSGLETLSAEIERSRRSDIVEALSLDEIAQEISAFIPGIQKWSNNDDMWETGIRGGFNRGWLHNLLRADRLFRTYLAEVRELDGLRHAINDCAAAFENALQDLGMRLIEVKLLEPLPRDKVTDEISTIESINKIPEIRGLVVKKRNEFPDQRFVVDIKHFGLEGRPGNNSRVRIFLHNRGEWLESSDNARQDVG